VQSVISMRFMADGLLLLVAALLADGVLVQYETETDASMRHGPNASLQLHTRCIEDRRKTKKKEERRRRCTRMHAHWIPNRHAPLPASTDRLRRRHEWDTVAWLGVAFYYMIYALSPYLRAIVCTRFAATLQHNLLCNGVHSGTRLSRSDVV
jgi:hypothetical protein